MSTTEHQLRLLTPSEVAVELRISTPTVYRVIGRGELKAARVGGQLRVDRVDLDQYLRGDSEGDDI